MFVNSALRMPGISVLLFNWAMDVYEIRRRNIDVLLAEAESLKAIGEAIRRVKAADPKAATADYANTLSQYKGGKRMGRAFAQDLEDGMGKPRGWMDHAQFEAAELSLEAKEAGQIIMNMDPAKRAFHMELLRRENESNPRKSAASPFGPLPKGGKPARNGGTQ